MVRVRVVLCSVLWWLGGCVGACLCVCMGASACACVCVMPGFVCACVYYFLLCISLPPPFMVLAQGSSRLLGKLQRSEVPQLATPRPSCHPQFQNPQFQLPLDLRVYLKTRAVRHPPKLWLGDPGKWSRVFPLHAPRSGTHDSLCAKCFCSFLFMSCTTLLCE